MNLVTIGQFSQMTRLSTKALRLYDQNGLIPPAHIDPSSGYRYYDLTQANRAEAVRILRSIDMPLDEIKTVLDAEDNPEMIHKLLGMHRERLVDRLAADERMLRYLESLMERKDGIMPYTVEIDEVEPRPVAAIRLRTSISKVGRDVGAAFGRLIAELGQAGIEPAGPPLTVHHEIIDNETDGDIEVCIQITGISRAATIWTSARSRADPWPRRRTKGDITRSPPPITHSPGGSPSTVMRSLARHGRSTSTIRKSSYPKTFSPASSFQSSHRPASNMRAGRTVDPGYSSKQTVSVALVGRAWHARIRPRFFWPLVSPSSTSISTEPSATLAMQVPQ